MAFGHVILKEFYVNKQSQYFHDYVTRYTDMPMLVMLEPGEKALNQGRFLRAADLVDNLGEENNPDWKTIAVNEKDNRLTSPNGSIGYRWGQSGKWNLEQKDKDGDVDLQLSLKDNNDEIVEVGFPYFGSAPHEYEYFQHTEHDEVQIRKVPVKKVELANGETAYVATVFDLMLAQYGVDNGVNDENRAKDYTDDVPYTPAWQEHITGVKPADVIRVATEFGRNADKTKGRSMIIVGAGMNHWYHMDMNYRALINMLIMCGCIGQSGGGWAHYVGQEKLRPQTGWQPLAFGLD
jgi:nitrate reductase alpha subunit